MMMENKDKKASDFVILETEGGNQKVWEELNEMRKEDVMCDMQFTGSDSKAIPAHSCVIAASSICLRTTLSKVLKDSKFVIELPSISSHVIESILTFIYTGKLCVEACEVVNVAATANVLSIESLMNVCNKLHGETTVSQPHQTGNEELTVLDSNEQKVEEASIDMEENIVEVKEETSTVCFIQAADNDVKTADLLKTEKQQPEEQTQIMEDVNVEMSSSISSLAMDTSLTNPIITQITADTIAPPCVEQTESIVTISGEADDNDTIIQPVYDSVQPDESTETIIQPVDDTLQEEEPMVVDTVINTEVITAEVDEQQVLSVEGVITTDQDGEVIDDEGQIITIDPTSGATNDEQTTIQVESSGRFEVDGNEAVTTTYVTVPSYITTPTESEVNQDILQKILSSTSGDYVEEVQCLPEDSRPKIKTESHVYVCEFCGLNFDKLPAFRSHLLKVKHDMKDPFSCKICGNRFKYKHNMKHHMSRHLAVKPYICLVESCHKSFSTKADLMTHNRSHTGDKPYTCEYCHKGFSQSSNLLTHKRSVHNTEFMGGARNFGCGECGKRFKTKDMLSKHIKRHKQTLTCGQCTEQFRVRKDLQKHTKDVHGITEFIPAKEDGDTVELYQCTSCDKTFMEMPKLTQHLEIVHKKAKRYSCSMESCNYTAYFKYAVERHYVKVHVEGSKTKSRPGQKFTCTKCGAHFGGFRGLGVHVRKQHGYEGVFTYDQAIMCAEELKSEKIVKNLSSPSKPSDEEEDIESSFVNNVNKQDREDTGVVKATSDGTISGLTKVASTSRRDKNIYECKQCGDMLSSEYALKKHKSLHKISEKRDIFTCSQCNKTFFQKAHLKRHVIQHHSKEIRFKCVEPQCPYECYYISQMKGHYKSKHKKSDIPEECVLENRPKGCDILTDSRFKVVQVNDQDGADDTHDLEKDVKDEIRNIKQMVENMSNKVDTITVIKG